jgi:hypothetical protein
MSQKKFFLLFWAIILTVSIASCNLGESLPTCDPDIIHASGITPNYRQPVLDLTHWSIQWWYYIEISETTSTDIDCEPEAQHIRIGLRTFDEAGNIVLTPLLEEDLPGYARAYSPT